MATLLKKKIKAIHIYSAYQSENILFKKFKLKKKFITFNGKNV